MNTTTRHDSWPTSGTPRVLHPACGAGVLALHPHGGGALLEIPRLVHHQHRAGVTQVLDQVGAQVIADAVLVPHRAGQQVLPLGHLQR